MRKFFIPPTTFFISIIGMLLLHSFAPVAQPIGSCVNWSGFILMLIGVAIASWHSRLFKDMDTNINTFEKPNTLIRQGLFQYSRNPMYLGFVICLIGIAVYLGSLTPFVMVAGFFLLAHYWYIPFEERDMQAVFGFEYQQYRKVVRRWI